MQKVLTIIAFNMLRSLSKHKAAIHVCSKLEAVPARNICIRISEDNNKLPLQQIDGSKREVY
jgi:hypothetical protein